jgi:hypothetical protein
MWRSALAIPIRILLLSKNLIRESVDIRARALRICFFEHLDLLLSLLRQSKDHNFLLQRDLISFSAFLLHFCIVSFLSTVDMYWLEPETDEKLLE